MLHARPVPVGTRFGYCESGTTGDEKRTAAREVDVGTTLIGLIGSNVVPANVFEHLGAGRRARALRIGGAGVPGCLTGERVGRTRAFEAGGLDAAHQARLALGVRRT